MALIPGAPLPDTLPSDALLYAAKESIGTATTSGVERGGQVRLYTRREEAAAAEQLARGRRCSDKGRRQPAARRQAAHIVAAARLRLKQQAGYGGSSGINTV